MREVLRVLELCPTGGNTPLLKRWIAHWGISTDHFDPRALRGLPRAAKPLAEILVEGSSYARANLKTRLYAEGIKAPICELCGQGELWRGRPMGLILDHINGVRDDHRLENLRIVCPNCAATLDTHCGRKNRLERPRACLRCGGEVPCPTPAAALLLARVRRALRAQGRPNPEAAPRGAAALRSAPAGDRGDELRRGRPPLRRVGQRGPQMGAPVRAGGGRHDQRNARTSASGSRMMSNQ